jgi:hypothetical protein
MRVAPNAGGVGLSVPILVRRELHLGKPYYGGADPFWRLCRVGRRSAARQALRERPG